MNTGFPDYKKLINKKDQSGFVNYFSSAHAQKALDALDGHLLDNLPLVISFRDDYAAQMKAQDQLRLRGGGPMIPKGAPLLPTPQKIPLLLTPPMYS
jgi:hypothetical protein